MYIHRCLLFAALMISWLARASCLSNPSYNLVSRQQTKSCPSDGTPVCGLQDKQLLLFPNECLFDAANEGIRLDKTIFTKVPLQDCMQGCRFSCSETYKPVCVRNKTSLQNRLFRNQCELSKNVCKTNADYLTVCLYECLPRVEPQIINRILEKREESVKNGKKPIPCTNVFKPVCGSYLGVKSSFKNECILNAENVSFDRDWRIIKYGMCPEDLAKTRRRKHKPANTHEIQKRSCSNILNNQYTAAAQLATNVGNKNQLSVSSNDLYSYLESALRDEFLNHDSANCHHPLVESHVHDEYLKKIGALNPFHMPYSQAKEPELNSKDIIIKPIPFSVNRGHLTYKANTNLADEINQQTRFPGAKSIKPINDLNERQIYYALKLKPNMSIKKDTKKREENSMTKNECEFGSSVICATLANGTLQSFATICDMMAANVYLEKTWIKLHNGSCEECKYNCSREYKPVCVSRNGVNYTMVNECYYNMAVCLDRKSKWQILSKKECERYTRIPVKYSGMKSGFRCTSSYSETTEIANDDLTRKAISNRSNRRKPRKNKKNKVSTKRAINKFHDNNCSRSHLDHQLMELAQKSKSCNDTTLDPLLTLQSQTESHIMSLL